MTQENSKETSFSRESSSSRKRSFSSRGRGGALRSFGPRQGFEGSQGKNASEGAEQTSERRHPSSSKGFRGRPRPATSQGEGSTERRTENRSRFGGMRGKPRRDAAQERGERPEREGGTSSRFDRPEREGRGKRSEHLERKSRFSQPNTSEEHGERELQKKSFQERRGGSAQGFRRRSPFNRGPRSGASQAGEQGSGFSSRASSSQGRSQSPKKGKPPFRMTFRGVFNTGLHARGKSPTAQAAKKGGKNVAVCFDLDLLDPMDLERNSVTMEHSAFVARAARLLAERIEGLDPLQAFEAGLFHDFGKLYLPRGWVYRHPRLGADILKKLRKEKRWLAAVCLAHPFPVLSNEAYITTFCRGDEEEANALKTDLTTIHLPSLEEPLNPSEDPQGVLIRLIQLCDKLSGFDRYVTLDEKFSWYEQWTSVPGGTPSSTEITPEAQARAVNYAAWRTIKNQIDTLIQGDVYKVLGLEVKE